MAHLFKSKLRINKANGQINIALLKKKLPPELKANPEKIKKLLWRIEGWEW